MRRRPPAMAESLLRAVAPPDDAAFIAGDMLELFTRTLEVAGPRAARRQYWIAVLQALPHLLARRFERSESSMFVDLADDVRFAFRLAQRTPVATAAILLTMILAVASVTSVFSVVDAVLLRPLPFANSERVVELRSTYQGGEPLTNLAYPDLQDYRVMVPAFEALSAVTENVATLTGAGEPRQFTTVQVDSAYQDVMAARVERGRFFAPADFAVSAPNVVVLGNGYWRHELGASPSVVGSTMVLNEEPHLVIGVLGPSDFQYPQPGAELYLPLRIYPGTMMVNRGAMWVGAVARLRPGTLLASARAQLASVAGVLERRNPGDAGLSATILPLREAVGGSVGGMMALLSLAVGAVLAIACLNIANLLLGLSQARSRELAVRAALGGSAFRVRRQLLTESLVLAAVGGGIALALAPALTRALLAAYPGSLPRAAEVGMSPRVIMAGVTVSLAMALFVSLPLLRRTGRGNVPGRLRSGWREGRSAAERRFGDLLVASQVAVSLAVVAAAVLMVRTVVRLSSIDPGYDPRGAISFRLYASAVRFPGSSGAARFYDQVLAGIRTIPGVRGATTITQVPFSGSFGDVFVREDVGDQGQANPHTQIVGVSAGFERVLGLPLRAGRSFEVIDGADSSAPVVVIDETLARRAFRGTDPVGKLIAWQGRQHWRVVGVVGLSRSDALYDEPPPHLYFSTKQIPRRGLYVVVRTSPRPQTLLPELRAIVRSVDPEVAITNVETFDDALGHSIAPHRFRAWLTGVMAAVAFLLAILGIYAVVAYGVARQARETGIRMALGEDQASVRRRVVVMALRVAAAGVLAGLAISLVSARWLGAFLVGVSPYSAGTLAAVAAAMLAVTGLAAAIPAARASRTDPAVALRAD